MDFMSDALDNGPEFISLELSEWCRLQQVELQYIQPGKPMQNGYIERFNRTFRQDVLDAHLFSGIDQVRVIAEKWMDDYKLPDLMKRLAVSRHIKLKQNFHQSKLALMKIEKDLNKRKYI